MGGIWEADSTSVSMFLNTHIYSNIHRSKVYHPNEWRRAFDSMMNREVFGKIVFVQDTPSSL